VLVKIQLYKKLLTHNSFAVSSRSLLHFSTKSKNEESKKEIDKNKEEFLQWFVGFSDAAAVVGVNSGTLSRHLVVEALEGHLVELKGNKVKRIPVYYPKAT